MMLTCYLKRGARLAFLTFFILVFGLRPVWAEDQSSELKELKRQVEELRSEFHSAIAEKQKKIDELELQVQALRKNTPAGRESKAAAPGGVQQAQPSVPGANEKAAPEQVQKQIRTLNEKVDQVAEAQKKSVPSEFNPSIGLVGETIFSYRSKGSEETGSDRPGGFDVFQRSMELNLAGIGRSVRARLCGDQRLCRPGLPAKPPWGWKRLRSSRTSLPWNLTVQGGTVLRRVRPAGLHPRS